MVAPGGTHSRFSGVIALLGLLAVLVVANSGFSDLTDGRGDVTRQTSRDVSARGPRSDGRHARDRRFDPVALLRADARAVPSNTGRVFVWPTRGTSASQRAVRMARHGDPEARRFVGRESDINPFDVQ
jgi:hypothetical protein